MHETLWYLIIGAVLLGMGVVTSALRHLPCSSAMIYLVLGIALGPAGAGLLHLDLERDGQLLREIERLRGANQAGPCGPSRVRPRRLRARDPRA